MEGPPPKIIDQSIDEAEYTVEKWKEVIWREVVHWSEIDDTGLPNTLETGKKTEKESSSGTSVFCRCLSLMAVNVGKFDLICLGQSVLLMYL